MRVEHVTLTITKKIKIAKKITHKIWKIEKYATRETFNSLARTAKRTNSDAVVFKEITNKKKMNDGVPCDYLQVRIEQSNLLSPNS